MESKAKFLGHPIHPMLIVFPVGLFATSVIFDLVSMSKSDTNLHPVAYWMIIGGVVGGVAAAIFGIVDWLAIPSKTRAKTIGAVHGFGNVFVILLFSASAAWRSGDPANPPTLALGFSFVAFVLTFVTAWLGGELVDRLGIGVDDGAHADAPSSLRGPVHRAQRTQFGGF